MRNAADNPWFAGVVTAARAHGVDILDGVYNDLGNAEGFARECAEARDMGFDGKTLIHPRTRTQVATSLILGSRIFLVSSKFPVLALQGLQLLGHVRRNASPLAAVDLRLPHSAGCSRSWPRST
jgi:hypothetical protein